MKLWISDIYYGHIKYNVEIKCMRMFWSYYGRVRAGFVNNNSEGYVSIQDGIIKYRDQLIK